MFSFEDPEKDSDFSLDTSADCTTNWAKPKSCYLKSGNDPPSNSPLGCYNSAAVCSESKFCATVATDILKEGGSVADAAIGCLLCMGIIHCHSMGIGGGFLAVIYNATTKQAKFLNARPAAPSSAHKHMFDENPANARSGGLSFAVPGEITGYWELHRAHGLLPWKRLFQPAIDMALKGFKVTQSSANALKASRSYILNEPSLAEVFLNPATGDVWKVDDVMTRPKLAETLQTLANKGGDAFYEGPLASSLISDLRSFGGIVTEDDLKNYKVLYGDAIEVEIGSGIKLSTVPPPGSGILLGLILRVLNGQLHKPTTMEDYIQNYQQITETFKYAFALHAQLGDTEDEEVAKEVEKLVKLVNSEEYGKKIREKLMNDSTSSNAEYYGPQFEPVNDGGTAHLSIIGPNGDAISVTSSINSHFGAKIRSKSTGVIFNNQMQSFSIPKIKCSAIGRTRNYVQPGKRPMSSKCPSIFTSEDGSVRLVIGAAGHKKILTATALVSINNLFFDMNIKEAMDERRLHHQLIPMAVSTERDFSGDVLDALNSYGHALKTHLLNTSIVSAVARTEDGTLQATYDFRKSGSIDGY